MPPLPPLAQAIAPKPPQIAKHAFIPPLTLTLKGIAFSSDEERSVSIIEDEAKKESVYHVGDLIKDAQLIKISQNRITLLRVNGQHETIFLRDADIPKSKSDKKGHDHIAKKIDNTTYEIDSANFAKEIPNLGSLSERFSLIGVYSKEKPTGVAISNMPINGIGTSIGLQKNDIITAINGISTTDKKNRMKIYDTITSMQNGSSITLDLQRNKLPVKITYNLTELKKLPKRVFAPSKQDDKQKRQKKKRKSLSFPLASCKSEQSNEENLPKNIKDLKQMLLPKLENDYWKTCAHECVTRALGKDVV